MGENKGQLSFDWSQNTATPVMHSVELQLFPPATESSVVCFQTHKFQRDEQDRSYHFSEIIKLVAHLNR
jgi:hypothetical protein